MTQMHLKAIDDLIAELIKPTTVRSETQSQRQPRQEQTLAKGGSTKAQKPQNNTEEDAFRWQYLTGDKWTDYEVSVCWELEKGERITYDCKKDNETYKIDPNKRVEINTNFMTVRRIRRVQCKV